MRISENSCMSRLFAGCFLTGVLVMYPLTHNSLQSVCKLTASQCSTYYTSNMAAIALADRIASLSSLVIHF